MTKEQFNTDDGRWKAVSDNDPAADGEFYYAVITTGVYCRPSCPSRLPNRINVEYFMTSSQAEAAGYRACKRCNPTADSKNLQVERKIIHACRLIENSETFLRLDELAKQVGLSPYHFHRLFRKIIGVTPKQYAARNKAVRFRKSLETSPSVTDAIYSAGYGSSGGAYDKARNQLAMQPKIYRKGGKGETIIYGLAESYLGWIIVAATDRGICAIEFGDEPDKLPDQIQDRFPGALLKKADSSFRALIREVVAFIKSPQGNFEVPLDIQGTAFQQKVWEILRQIRPGETMSYTDVAERIGNPNAVRAVASACAANKLAVVIPCHRVVPKSGKTGGYRWGTGRKRILLQSEEESG